MFGFHIIKQYERAVVFHLGRVNEDDARGPGLIFLIPLVNRVRRVSLRIVTLPIQSQGIITSDNVSIDVSAVAYYRVQDPVRSVLAIENVSSAINQIAQTTLRAVVGRHTLDETLSETPPTPGGGRGAKWPAARRTSTAGSQTAPGARAPATGGRGARSAQRSS